MLSYFIQKSTTKYTPPTVSKSLSPHTHIEYIMFSDFVHQMVKMMLIIPGFFVCELAYSLEFIFNPQINTPHASWVIHRPAQSNKIFESPNTHFSSWWGSGWCFALPSCLSSHVVHKCNFLQSTLCYFFYIFCACQWFHSLKWLPSVDMQSGVCKCKEAVMYLREKNAKCMHLISSIQAWIIVLLVVSSMLMTQSTILIK